jgi:hypothetical protein
MNVKFKKQFSTMPIIVTLFAFSFNTKNANEIEGFWFSKDVDNSEIKVVRETSRDVWSAEIIKSDKPKYVGKVLFRNCVFNSKDLNYTTTITSPSMNADINATITISGKHMTIVGKKLFFTKTFVWTRKE